MPINLSINLNWLLHGFSILATALNGELGEIILSHNTIKLSLFCIIAFDYSLQIVSTHLLTATFQPSTSSVYLRGISRSMQQSFSERCGSKIEGTLFKFFIFGVCYSSMIFTNTCFYFESFVKALLMNYITLEYFKPKPLPQMA